MYIYRYTHNLLIVTIVKLITAPFENRKICIYTELMICNTVGRESLMIE